MVEKLAGLPIVVNESMPPNSIILIGKNTPKPWIMTDRLETVELALDDEFLRTCGIITGIRV